MLVQSEEKQPAVLAFVPREADHLGLVVVTYNSADVLPGLLDSLAAGLRGIDTYEIVIVDNDSTDASVEIAQNHAIAPKVIRLGRNAGYAAGINAATSVIARRAHLLVLNPDIRLLPGTCRLLCDHLRDPSVGVVAPQILNEDGTVAKSVRREPSMLTAWSDALLGTRIAARLGAGEIVDDPAVYNEGGAIEWATGAILMIPSHARLAIGEWDETFFLYSEEVDYMQRIRQIGLSVKYAPEARAVHIGGEYHDNIYLAGLMTANRIRYYARHNNRAATALFRLSIIVGAAMRAALGPGHRAALRAAITLQPKPQLALAAQ